MAYTTQGNFTTDANGSVIGSGSPQPSGLYLSLVKGTTANGFTSFAFVLSEPAPEDTWIWFHTTNPSDVETATAIEGMGQSVVVQIPVEAGDVVLDGAMLANRRTPVPIGYPTQTAVITGERGPITSWFEEAWKYQAASGQVYKNFTATKFGNGLIKVRQAFPINGTGPLTADGYALVIENVTARDGYRLLETENTLANFRISNVHAEKLQRGGIRFKTGGGTPTRPSIIEGCYIDCGGEEYFRYLKANGLTWQSLYFPVGIDFSHTAHITARDTTVKGAWTPPQEESGAYRQGDGFLTENQSHHITFLRTHADSCMDAGYDLKGSEHQVLDSSATGCKTSIKWWGSSGKVGVFTSRNPLLEHICVVAGAAGAPRTRIDIERLIIEGTDPNRPILRLDGPAGVDVVVRSWEIRGMDPASVVATWTTDRASDTVNTVDWGPKGPPSIINI